VLVDRVPTWVFGLGFCLVVVVLGLRTYDVLAIPGHVLTDKFGLSDFRDAIYYPIVSMLEGFDPYNVEEHMARYPVGNHFPLYSPLTLLVHLPFALLPFQIAQVAYFAVQIGLSLVLARLALAMAEVEVNWSRIFIAASLVLISRPGHNNLVLGQSTFELVIFCFLALHYARTRPNVAGVALALATFKPTFGVPIFILMLCRRDFRACGVAFVAGSIGTLLITGVLIANAGGPMQLVQDLLPNNAQHESLTDVSNSLTRIDTYALISRWWEGLPQGATELIFGMLLLGLMGLVVYKTEQEGAPSLVSWTSTLICMTTLACAYHQEYSALLLTGLAVTLVSGCFAHGRAEAASWLTPAARKLLGGSILLLACNYLATRTGVRLMQPDETMLTIISSLNGVAILVALVTTLFVGGPIANALAGIRRGS